MHLYGGSDLIMVSGVFVLVASCGLNNILFPTSVSVYHSYCCLWCVFIVHVATFPVEGQIFVQY